MAQTIVTKFPTHSFMLLVEIAEISAAALVALRPQTALPEGDTP